MPCRYFPKSAWRVRNCQSLINALLRRGGLRLTEQRWRSSTRPSRRRIIGVSQLQTRQFSVIWSDNLDADRQTLVIKARWGGQSGTSGHCYRRYAFHPLVIGLHLRSGDFLRPMSIDVEREKLRSRKDDVVELLKELPHGLVPRRDRTTDAAVMSKALSFRPLSTSKMASGFIRARFTGSL